MIRAAFGFGRASLRVALAMLAASLSNQTAAEPDRLDIAVVMAPESEAGWDVSFRRALTRFEAARPEDHDIRVEIFAPASKRLAELAQSGEFDVIWAHSHASDRVAPLMKAHPEILFVVAGAGNRPLGANQYWVMKRLHEPSFLLGALAARLSEGGVIGVVGTVPYEDVNDQINAFIAGARTARADATPLVAFIDAWSGPEKVETTTRALAERGADAVFRLAPGLSDCAVFGVVCFGNFVARQGEAGAALALWEADLRAVAALWRSGPPYDAPREGRWLGLAEGGAALALSPDAIPASIRAEIAALEAEILSGARAVAIDPSPPPRTDPGRGAQ